MIQAPSDGPSASTADGRGSGHKCFIRRGLTQPGGAARGFLGREPRYLRSGPGSCGTAAVSRTNRTREAGICSLAALTIPHWCDTVALLIRALRVSLGSEPIQLSSIKNETAPRERRWNHSGSARVEVAPIDEGKNRSDPPAAAEGERREKRREAQGVAV